MSGLDPRWDPPRDEDAAGSAYEALSPAVRVLVDKTARTHATARGVSFEEAREQLARAVKTKTSSGGTGMGH